MWKALVLALTLVTVVLSHPIENADEQSAEDGAIRQRRDTQEAAGDAVQTDEAQEAWADGNYAKQGDDGQFVVASDYGGPIVQILQRVFRTGNCCACGCNCGCPGDEEETTTTEAST